MINERLSRSGRIDAYDFAKNLIIVYGSSDHSRQYFVFLVS